MATESEPVPDELQAPAPSNITPQTLAEFREQLKKKNHDVVDGSWAGSVPVQYGVAPRLRIGRTRWFNLLWLLPIGFVLLIVAVAVAKGLRDVPGVAQFIAEHPGTVVPSGAEENAGFPAWVGWQHFLSMLLLIPIIRSGVTIIVDHPRFYWTRHSTPGKEWLRVQKPVPSDPLFHGAPLRLRNEVQLGFKLVKWIRGIGFVEDFSDIGGGEGGYNNDHEFFGYRQSI